MFSWKFAAVLLIAGSVHAETVSVVSGDDYAPYADSKLPEGGMSTDLVKKAFAEVKIDIKVDWQPWARGLDETKQGTFAGTFPYLKNEEREKDFLYSDVLIKLQEVVFIKSTSKKYNFSDTPGLAGSTICLPLGWAPAKKLEEMIKNGKIKKVSPKNISNCVKMVESERADYFISDEAQGLAALKSGGVPAGSVILAPGPAFSDNSLYFVAGKNVPGSKDIIAAFNKGLEALRKSGAYDKIVKAHSK